LDELSREGWEVDNKREYGLSEVREVFAEYGLSGAALESIVSSITPNRKRWIDFMMRFELGLERPDPKRAPISAVTIAVSYLVGGLTPLLPYMLTSNLTEALKISVPTTGVALLIFGGVKGHFTGLNRLVSAGQTLLVGGLGAAAAFWLAHPPRLRCDMPPELVGNPVRQILDGGVISATLDVVGGLAIALASITCKAASRQVGCSTLTNTADGDRPRSGRPNRKPRRRVPMGRS
jgi:VIT family protein